MHLSIYLSIYLTQVIGAGADAGWDAEAPVYRSLGAEAEADDELSDGGGPAFRSLGANDDEVPGGAAFRSL